MQELIKIVIGENNEQLVSARELHEFLESKERFSKWFDKMLGYGFEEGVDYTPYQTVHPQNLQDISDFVLKIDMAKEISMVSKLEKGKIARKYFIECERKLKQVATKQLPQDYINALKALVESEEQKALMQPQVEYYQKVLNPTDSGFIKLVTTTAIAKDLGMSAQKLNKLLNENRIIYKQGSSWFLYAEHESKVPEYADYTINEYGQTLKFTEKGREWILDIVSKNLKPETIGMTTLQKGFIC